jgi:hypothetical protein
VKKLAEKLHRAVTISGEVVEAIIEESVGK